MAVTILVKTSSYVTVCTKLIFNAVEYLVTLELVARASLLSGHQLKQVEPFKYF